jgi:hypothetical protein
MKGEVCVLDCWHDQQQQAQTWDHTHQPIPNYQMLSRIDNQAHAHPSKQYAYQCSKLSKW